MRTKADAARYQAEQEAAGIRARGEAEAAAIQAKAVAEAEGMEKKRKLTRSTITLLSSRC